MKRPTDISDCDFIRLFRNSFATSPVPTPGAEEVESINQSTTAVAYTRCAPLPLQRFLPARPRGPFHPRVFLPLSCWNLSLWSLHVCPRKSRLTARSLKLCPCVVHKNVTRTGVSWDLSRRTAAYSDGYVRNKEKYFVLRFHIYNISLFFLFFAI